MHPIQPSPRTSFWSSRGEYRWITQMPMENSETFSWKEVHNRIWKLDTDAVEILVRKSILALMSSCSQWQHRWSSVLLSVIRVVVRYLWLWKMSSSRHHLCTKRLLTNRPCFLNYKRNLYVSFVAVWDNWVGPLWAKLPVHLPTVCLWLLHKGTCYDWCPENHLPLQRLRYLPAPLHLWVTSETSRMIFNTCRMYSTVCKWCLSTQL